MNERIPQCKERIRQRSSPSSRRTPILNQLFGPVIFMAVGDKQDCLPIHKYCFGSLLSYTAIIFAVFIYLAWKPLELMAAKGSPWAVIGIIFGVIITLLIIILATIYISRKVTPKAIIPIGIAGWLSFLAFLITR